MSIKERMSGNEAVAYAIRQVNPDVMPAFPITPSTEIPQMVSTYIANGQMDTEFIPVESEHSSMSATIGAGGSRSQKSYCYIFCRSGIDVGGTFTGSVQPPAISDGIGKPYFIRPDQYQLRSLRWNGSQRYRMDPDLCGEQPGGI